MKVILQEDAVLQSEAADSPHMSTTISLVLRERFAGCRPKEKARWIKLSLLFEDPETLLQAAISSFEVSQREKKKYHMTSLTRGI